MRCLSDTTTALHVRYILSGHTFAYNTHMAKDKDVLLAELVEASKTTSNLFATPSSAGVPRDELPEDRRHGRPRARSCMRK